MRWLLPFAALLLGACSDPTDPLTDPGALEAELLDDPLTADVLELGDPSELESDPAFHLLDYVSASVDITWDVAGGDAEQRARVYAEAGREGGWQIIGVFCSESKDRYWLRFSSGREDRRVGIVEIEPTRVEVHLSAAHPEDDDPLPVPASPSRDDGYVDCGPLTSAP